MREVTPGQAETTDRAGLTRRETLLMGGAGVAALMSPALLAACGGDEATAELRDPILNGQSFAPVTFDPHTASEIGAISLIIYAYEPLYGKSPEPPYDIVPLLAQGDPEELSPTRQRVRLRSGAKWHDGSPVTANDVEASFKRILNPDTASLLLGFLTVFKGVKSVDDRTVEIELNFPTTLLKERLGLVKIVPAEATTAERPARTFNRKPVGSGPYQVTSIAPNLRKVRLERFRGYNGPVEATLRRIGSDVILDDQARIAALQTNRLAAMADPPFRAIDRLNDDSKLDASGVPSFQQSLLIFNCGKNPFDDKRVRQAILHAIDRETITKSVFFGRAQAATSYLPAENPDYKEPATSLGYDPERARSLLNEAGQPNVKLTLLLSNLGWLAPQAPLIEGQLGEVGIDATIQQGEVESLVANVTDGSFDAWLTVTDPTIFGNSDGEFLIRWIYVNLAAGFLYWSTPASKQLASLLDQALRSRSSEEVKQLVGQAQDIIADEAPAFPLHHRQSVAAWSTGLELKVDPVYGVNLMQASRAG